MKKLLLALAAAALAQAAFALPTGAYMGVNVGTEHGSPDIATLHQLDSQAPVVSVVMGRTIDSHWGMETSLIDFGHQNGVRYGQTTSVHGYAATFQSVYRQVLWKSVTGSAQAGLAYSRADVAGEVASRLSPVMGVGLTYPVAPNMDVTFRWQRLQGLGQATNRVDSTTLGLIYKY